MFSDSLLVSHRLERWVVSESYTVSVIKRFIPEPSFCSAYNYTAISLLFKAIQIQHVMRGECNYYISQTEEIKKE